MDELPLDYRKVTFHTDSKTVIQWINSKTCKFTVFVGNKIGKIHRETEPEQWRNVKGLDNPADACSRGIAPTDIDALIRFHQGPKFLLPNRSKWDRNEDSDTNENEIGESTVCAAIDTSVCDN